MLLSETIRDLGNGSCDCRILLVCDGCRCKSSSAYCYSHKEPDGWDRLSIPAKGWSQQLVGRYLRDFCPICTKKRAIKAKAAAKQKQKLDELLKAAEVYRKK